MNPLRNPRWRELAAQDMADQLGISPRDALELLARAAKDGAVVPIRETPCRE